MRLENKFFKVLRSANIFMILAKTLSKIEIKNF